MMNTHFYDGKLSAPLHTLQLDLERAKGISPQEKASTFAKLQEFLRISLSPTQFDTLKCLITQKTHMYDPINTLSVADLLVLCYEKIVLEGDEAFKSEFTIQLQDLPGGMCVQGRTIRLLQLLYAFAK